MPAFGGRLSDDDIQNVAAFVIDQAEGGKWGEPAGDGGGLFSNRQPQLRGRTSMGDSTDVAALKRRIAELEREVQQLRNAM